MILDFKFHNVGQGLFYTGIINNFKFVYDCGTSKLDRKYLEDAIINYKKNTHKLNLLILSHLHSDHVSGLDFLLRDMEVNTVVLPYLTRIERLVISLMRLDQQIWYYEFLSDPVSFLINKGVKRIILIGGSEGCFPEVQPSPELINNEEPDIKELSKSDPNLEREIIKNDPHLEEQFEQRLFVRNHDGYIKALGIWFFRFFNYKININLVPFKTCVDQLLGKDKDIVDVIRTKNLSKLRKCYYKIKNLGNFNNTSLITYHASIKSLTRFLTIKSECVCPFCNFFQCNTPLTLSIPLTLQFTSRSGQFLMGDIDLNFNFDEIHRHYQKYFQEAFLSQVPHHGSVKNWNSRVLNLFNSDTLWVASAGTRNTFGHPDPNVISSIRKKHHFFWCNEFARIRLTD